MDLTKLYQLIRDRKVDEALDVIYAQMDELFKTGKFNQVDTILENVDFGQLDLDTQLGFLTATLAAKEYLKKREAFFQKVKRFVETTEPRETQKGLLDGLR